MNVIVDDALLEGRRDNIRMDILKAHPMTPKPPPGYAIPLIYERQFVCIFHYNCWWHFSFGIHIDFRSPNIELHVPTGFFKIGWEGICSRRIRPTVIGKDYVINHDQT